MEMHKKNFNNHIVQNSMAHILYLWFVQIYLFILVNISPALNVGACEY